MHPFSLLDSYLLSAGGIQTATVNFIPFIVCLFFLYDSYYAFNIYEYNLIITRGFVNVNRQQPSKIWLNDFLHFQMKSRRPL